MFVCEGIRVVEELARSGLPVRGVLISPQGLASSRAVTASGALRARGAEVVEVSDGDFATAA
ncbi:MAG TPA: hypothetical protein VFT96_11395, partial [Gemmatimonadaceae bacterium]|nr:hypothetical protein [Gemmatimonadaceae bacterium]